ncbi:MAG: phosphoglucosamine mutase [bacterium]
MRKIFGTDGVRGKANLEPMTVETATRLGQAVALVFSKRTTRSGRIVIGKDTRLSCYMFENALAAGIMSMGADVMIVGPLPTPGIAHITSSMRADAGLVISASHNPFTDNGIKIFAADGFKLPDDQEIEIERLMSSSKLMDNRPSGDRVGRARRIDDAIGRYVAFCKQTFPNDLTLEGMRLVVDTAHGAAYKVAPLVFSELGAEVFSIGNEPDGRNINYRTGALYPESMGQAVNVYRADLGIALDGDADRVMFADETGQVVDGDEIMAICATRMIAAGTLAHETLVTTVMSNIGLERAVEAAGGTMLRTQVGDRYVVETMRGGEYNFGGEQSGHLIFLDHMTTGDGIIAALQVLAVMKREGRPLSELRQVMTRYPQVLKNLPVTAKPPLDELKDVQAAIAAVEQKLGADGRVLVRYSGTEMKVRVMVEGPTRQDIHSYADDIAALLQKACQ